MADFDLSDLSLAQTPMEAISDQSNISQRKMGEQKILNSHSALRNPQYLGGL